VGLSAVLGAGPVALDTAIFIYFIEEHPDFLPLVAPLFEQTARGKMRLVTSAVTLLEVLVVPDRAGDLRLAEQYEALLTRSRGVELVDLDRAQLRGAAQLRAAYRIRTPDALQLAAALSTRCEAFVTNDRELPDLAGLSIIQLRDHLG
jgi:uncharacterized protein